MLVLGFYSAKWFTEFTGLKVSLLISTLTLIQNVTNVGNDQPISVTCSGLAPPMLLSGLASLTPSQTSHLPTSNPHHYSPCLVSLPLASHRRPTLLSLLPFSHCCQDVQFCCVGKALFPPLTQWIKEALHFMRLEKIKHTLRFSERTFHKIWQPFLDHVRSVHIEIDPDV